MACQKVGGRQRVEVAVVDPLPLFRSGVLAALGKGTALSTAIELQDWLAAHPTSILLLTLDGDEAREVLHRYRSHADVHIVGVLPSYTVISAADALRSGAVHVMPRQADAARVRAVVQQVTAGAVELPIAVVRASVQRAGATTRSDMPSDEELGWLRVLARGGTVAALAESAALSERVVYRRLAKLYRRLGVPNRSQAIILARDEGWL
jgi:DNA-binding NarL/FixJ family response regulator